MRVITQYLVVSQNKNFGHNPSCSYVKPVVTRGSTVLYYLRVAPNNASKWEMGFNSVA
jgi:hypothetical protein